MKQKNRAGAVQKRDEENVHDEGGEKLSRQKLFDVLCVLFLRFFCTLSLLTHTQTPTSKSAHNGEL